MTHSEMMILLNMMAEHEELRSMQVGSLGIIYDPLSDSGGAWEIYDGNNQGVLLDKYCDIHRCATVILAHVRNE